MEGKTRRGRQTEGRGGCGRDVSDFFARKFTRKKQENEYKLELR